MLIGKPERARFALLLLAGAAAAQLVFAQPVQPARAKAATKVSVGPPTQYTPNRFAGRAGMYYKEVWGIDALSVKWAESGELVRFSWHVVDAPRAAVLNDKKDAPVLEDPQSAVSLVVPELEKVGQLRQTPPPQAGKSYWVEFSNKGRRVKRGDRVNIVIGPFRANNLMVD